MAVDLAPEFETQERASEFDPLIYFAVGIAWAVVAFGIVRHARKDDARRRTRVVSSRLLSQVFPNGIGR